MESRKIAYYYIPLSKSDFTFNKASINARIGVIEEEKNPIFIEAQQ